MYKIYDGTLTKSYSIVYFIINDDTRKRIFETNKINYQLYSLINVVYIIYIYLFLLHNKESIRIFYFPIQRKLILYT